MGTRDVILDAAAEVIRTRGLANATTREIAKAAGYSEATLYKHFAGKIELLVAVLHERTPGLAQLAQAVSAAGDDLAEGLTAIATAMIAFYTDSFPTLGSIFSDPLILAAHTAGLRQIGAGPHKANEAVMGYLRRQQDRGLGPGRTRTSTRPPAFCSAPASSTPSSATCAGRTAAPTRTRPAGSRPWSPVRCSDLPGSVREQP